MLVPNPQKSLCLRGWEGLQDVSGEMGTQGTGDIGLGLGKTQFSFPSPFIPKLESVALAEPFKWI